jgi:hypothetical protein
MPDRLPIRPSAVLAAFVESLAEGRRVVVFGDASSRLSEHLLDRGARLIHVCDPDPTRLAAAVTRNTSQHVSYAPLSTAGLAYREGAFDLGIVENLSAFGDLEPSEVLRLLRRTVNIRGAAVVASQNPQVDAMLPVAGQAHRARLDYYKFYELMAAEFASVRMFGQMPFVGFSIAQFGRHEELEPLVDTALVPSGSEEPEWFVAVTGQRSQELEPFSVIQLPARDLLPGTIRTAEAKLRAALDAERAFSSRVAALEAELAAARAELETRASANEKARAREIERALEQREQWIEQLETRAATADARADSVQADLESAQAELAQLGAKAKETERQLHGLRQELEAERHTKVGLVDELDALRRDQEQATLGGSDDDVARLETQLLERGQVVMQLQQQLREAERLGRELIGQIEHPPICDEAGVLRGWEPPHDVVPPSLEVSTHAVLDDPGAWQGPEADAPTGVKNGLQARLDALSAHNARLSADLVAAQWAVELLEAELRRARANRGSAGPS